MVTPLNSFCVNLLSSGINTLEFQLSEKLESQESKHNYDILYAVCPHHVTKYVIQNTLTFSESENES